MWSPSCCVLLAERDEERVQEVLAAYRAGL